MQFNWIGPSQICSDNRTSLSPPSYSFIIKEAVTWPILENYLEQVTKMFSRDDSFISKFFSVIPIQIYGSF